MPTNQPDWDALAATITTWRDDPCAGVMPLAYVGPAFVAFVVFAMTLTSNGPLHGLLVQHAEVAVALLVAVILAAITTSTVATRVSHTRSLERARRRTARQLEWFADHVGIDLALGEINRSRYALHQRSDERPLGDSLQEVLAAWENLGSNVGDDALLTRVLRTATAKDQLALCLEIRANCFPRTLHGWTTDQNQVDVLPRALRRLCEHDTFDARSYRQAARQALYATA